VQAGFHGGVDPCLMAGLEQRLRQLGFINGSPPERVMPPPLRS
jgi:Fe2+ transport system protein FeoA